MSGAEHPPAVAGDVVPMRPKGTATSAFGVGRRESHDASAFYARFEAPEVSGDDTVVRAELPADPLFCGDARAMTELPDNSVALVVTSPPYYAGKEYEEALGQGHIPGSYLEFLDMLRDVFAECKRTLEPGGRIAVNVANLGRKPYRSLSSDVIRILQDDLRLLLRGEVIWHKHKGASGSAAWGSFRSAANPVLRDVTERVIIASKGRFDRARSARRREQADLPYRNDLTSDEFLAATLDVWEIPSERASRVGHPAPFPVELPRRVIQLYTYEDDLVLDPFLGSGTTAVAAVLTGRRYVGYDIEPEYLVIARDRVAAERHRLAAGGEPAHDPPMEMASLFADEDFQARASQEGKTYQGIAERVLNECGFTIVKKDDRRAKVGVTINFVATDAKGQEWFFDVSGAFTTTRGGLRRTDTVWKTLGRASVLRRHYEDTPVVLLTSHLPRDGSGGDQALRSVGPSGFFDAVEMLTDDGRPSRLVAYATGEHYERPLPGFWSEQDLASG